MAPGPPCGLDLTARAPKLEKEGQPRRECSEWLGEGLAAAAELTGLPKNPAIHPG